jgi:hypothetical protein
MKPCMRDQLGLMPHRTKRRRLHDRSHWREAEGVIRRLRILPPARGDSCVNIAQRCGAGIAVKFTWTLPLQSWRPATIKAPSGANPGGVFVCAWCHRSLARHLQVGTPPASWHATCRLFSAGDCRAQFETGRRRENVFRARRRIFWGLAAHPPALPGKATRAKGNKETAPVRG